MRVNTGSVGTTYGKRG